MTLGRIHRTRRDGVEAVNSYNEALRLNPRLYPAQVELGHIYLSQGKVNEAEQLALSAVKAQPGAANGQFLLTRVMLAKGNTKAADAPLKQLAAALPQSAPVQAQLGSLLLQKKDMAGARAAFQRAVHLDPNDEEALAGLLVLDARDGKIADARTRIEARVAAEPKNAGLLFLAARTYGVQRDLASTEKALRQAIAVDPVYLPAYSMLGQLYASQKRLDEARAGFEQLAKQMPKPRRAADDGRHSLQICRKIPSRLACGNERALAIDAQGCSRGQQSRMAVSRNRREPRHRPAARAGGENATCGYA